MKKLLLCGLLIVASSATYAQTYYPSGNTNIPTWGYNNVVSENGGNYYNLSTGKSGCVITDAELDFFTFGDGDAYDGAFEFFVNTSDSVYTESGINSGGVDTTGTTISLAEQLIGGLYVSKKYFFSPTEPVVRTTFKIRNPLGTPVDAKIGIYSNLGSDGNTTVDTSSTDGASLSDADRWMVTSDTLPYGTGDPINTWVRFGPGTIVSSPVFGSKPELGNDNYLDTVAVSVPANSYALIIQFNRLDSTQVAARINTPKFNSVAAVKSAGYLSGMSDAELAKVVNWDFSSILPITVNNPQTICANSSYTFNGHTYSVPGTYNDTLQRVVAGVDSIVVTQLTVNSLPVISSQSGNVTACGDVSALFTVNSAGTNTYQWTYKNIYPPYDSAIIDGTYTEINFNTDSMTIQGLLTGQYNDYLVYCTITNSNGCSINSMNDTIRVHAIDSTSFAQTICAGSSYLFNGVNYTTAGNHTVHFTNVNACDSLVTLVLTVNPKDSTSFSQAICAGSSYLFNGTNYSAAGNYTVTLTNVNGCDSLATLVLTVNQVDVTTSVNGITISSNENGATYQWIDCGNSNAIITNETNQNFTPVSNGSYAVIVTKNSCSDTSACVNVTSVGVSQNDLLNNISIYPNPNNGAFILKLNVSAQVVITNALGQIIVDERINDTTHLFSLQDEPNGVYFVKVITGNSQKLVKLIKQ